VSLRNRFFGAGELIAAEKKDEADIASFIGLDSLHYLSVEGMVQATELPRENFCLACYNGIYPLSPPQRFGNSVSKDAAPEGKRWGYEDLT